MGDDDPLCLSILEGEMKGPSGEIDLADKSPNAQHAKNKCMEGGGVERPLPQGQIELCTALKWRPGPVMPRRQSAPERLG